MKISELTGKQIDYWFDYVLAHGQKRTLGELKTETIRRYFGDEVPDLHSLHEAERGEEVGRFNESD